MLKNGYNLIQFKSKFREHYLHFIKRYIYFNESKQPLIHSLKILTIIQKNDTSCCYNKNKLVSFQNYYLNTKSISRGIEHKEGEDESYNLRKKQRLLLCHSDNPNHTSLSFEIEDHLQFVCYAYLIPIQLRYTMKQNCCCSQFVKKNYYYYVIRIADKICHIWNISKNVKLFCC